MVCKKPPEKRAKVGETGRVVRRKGVCWRNSRTCVVEMRLPKRVADLKLNFGSYKTEVDAMVARDYGAYLRDSSGTEDRATVGGYLDDHPSIFEFEECREIFEGLEASKARCDEYKSLLALGAEGGCSQFCMQAREDIGAAIEVFRKRNPQKFMNSRPVKTEPLDGEIRVSSPSSSVSPKLTPGCEAEDGNAGHLFFRTVDLAIAVDGSPFRTLLRMEVPRLNEEEISTIMKASIDRIHRELDVKCFEDLEPCTIDPSSIPPLDPGM